ncbi:P-loop containing nucleoside triphosphate hydrolase protein [Nemania abortiva]|nr:P-loop containing nucleoside triphosphate hydrolase protein [Nemania abortiva]
MPGLGPIHNPYLLSAFLSGRRPMAISGPSGVGKITLFQRLLETNPGVFATTVSHTTRKPRPGEDNAFFEYTEFNGNLYGTSKQTIIDRVDKDLVILLNIDMEGVKQLKEEQLKAGSQINPRFVFIKPPSYEALETRLRAR